MCGADNRSGQSPRYRWGSSPRVRSRPRKLQKTVSTDRIISACAEQTIQPRTRRNTRRDHLRVCGADFLQFGERLGGEGSSPRVRSRRTVHIRRLLLTGIISACAEQTASVACCGRGDWDHLRVCGADDTVTVLPLGMLGSSPRVRSRPDPRDRRQRVRGIISACAEQTHLRMKSACAAKDHLRVCGADHAA